MPTDSRSNQRKQRVVAACDFCRQRKFGCDNNKPKCTRCAVRGRECTYAERSNNERPSNSRIAQLQEENARLRVSLERLQTLSEPPLLSEHISGHATNVSLQTPVYASARLYRRPQAVTSAYARYHGPSSALHDAVAFDYIAGIAPSAEHSGAISELFESTSRQRQLETIDLKAGRFQMEGIDHGLGYDLLLAFWGRQHHSGSVVYRPVFMRDMANGGSYFSPLLMNAMLFVAFKHRSPGSTQPQDDDLCVNGITFRQRAEDILYHADTKLLTESSVTTAQALVIMADALFSWCDERSLAWHYLGIAINMIVDLGFHTTLSKSYQSRSAEDQEVGRRLFWSAYVADKVQSIYQGRPARLRISDSSVPILFLDDFEELEQFHSRTYSAVPCQLETPNRSVSTFEHLCGLSVISESIIALLYAETSVTADPESLLKASLILKNKLQHWRSTLPAHLDLKWEDLSSFDVLPHTLSLMAMYHSLTILLFRPFVSDGHLRAVDSSKTSSSFAACATAATEIQGILRLYEKHFCLKTCPYSLSYATYASGTIYARVAAQSPPGSQSQQMLRQCLQVLSLQQEQCHAPRQSMKILLLLAQKLGVDVGPGLSAAPSRTDCQAPVSATEPSTLAFDNATAVMLDPVGDIHLEDVDIDAIIRSFDLNPQLQTSSNINTNSQRCLDESPTDHYQHGYPGPDGAISNASDADFDSVFGFGTFLSS